mmetsp:Transcript_94786/g.163605  ORF Transcript_94786/g.163605 Transcript_94786/m.163605 type:complete len:209 (-) Transcript_94786:408-1034(-)
MEEDCRRRPSTMALPSYLRRCTLLSGMRVTKWKAECVWPSNWPANRSRGRRRSFASWRSRQKKRELAEGPVKTLHQWMMKTGGQTGTKSSESWSERRGRRPRSAKGTRIGMSVRKLRWGRRRRASPVKVSTTRASSIKLLVSLADSGLTRITTSMTMRCSRGPAGPTTDLTRSGSPQRLTGLARRRNSPSPWSSRGTRRMTRSGWGRS